MLRRRDGQIVDTADIYTDLYKSSGSSGIILISH